MMLVRNDSGRTVKETFFGHGTIEIESGEEKDIPEEVFKAWQSPNYWVGSQCPLVDVAAERKKENKTAAKTTKKPEEPGETGDTESGTDNDVKF